MPTSRALAFTHASSVCRSRSGAFASSSANRAEVGAHPARRSIQSSVRSATWLTTPLLEQRPRRLYTRNPNLPPGTYSRLKMARSLHGDRRCRSSWLRRHGPVDLSGSRQHRHARWRSHQPPLALPPRARSRTKGLRTAPRPPRWPPISAGAWRGGRPFFLVRRREHPHRFDEQHAREKNWLGPLPRTLDRPRCDPGLHRVVPDHVPPSSSSSRPGSRCGSKKGL